MHDTEQRAALSADTSAAAETVQIERWRAMSVREKARLVTQLSQAADAMALAGIRAAYRSASAREWFLRLAVRRLGRELAARAYPETADIAD